MQHRIVGILGRKQSGKDTVASTFVRYYGFRSLAMAATLKEMCRYLFILTEAQLNGDQKEVLDPRWGVTPRQLMQRVGTELFRTGLPVALPQLKLQGGSVWTRHFRMCLDVAQVPQRVVIPDIRFADEAAMVREMGGVLVRVERKGQAEDPHSSENSGADIEVDATLHNDGTLQELESDVINFIAKHVLQHIQKPRGLKRIPTSLEDLKAMLPPPKKSKKSPGMKRGQQPQ